MSVEGELGLRHWTVGYKSLYSEFVGVTVRVDFDLVAVAAAMSPRGSDGGGGGDLLLGTFGGLEGSQGDRNDDPIARAHPQAVAGYQQGSDAHEREPELPCAWNIAFVDISRWFFALKKAPNESNLSLKTSLTVFSVEIDDSTLSTKTS